MGSGPGLDLVLGTRELDFGLTNLNFKDDTLRKSALSYVMDEYDDDYLTSVFD